MKITETLYIADRRDWRAWLRKNHKSKKEIWLIYYKKNSGKPRIPYEDAVEEALCYGWIDTNVQRIDDDRYAQKFTPRRKGSKWSESNIRRMEKLIEAGKMTKAGLEFYGESAKKRVVKKPVIDMKIPPDLRKALTAKVKALANFNNFAASYRRNYLLWIAAAKRPETRSARIEKVAKWAAENQKPGML